MEMIERLLELDGQILLWIQDLRTNGMTVFFKAVTHLGDGGAVWIVLTAALLIPKKTRKVGIAMAIALALSFLTVNLLLKPVVERTRPYEVVEGLRLLVSPVNDYSFPSGHSASSMAAAVAMLTSLPEGWQIAGWCAVILAVLICVSRLYIGIHYPTDVLCGACIGILIGIISSSVVSPRT